MRPSVPFALRPVACCVLAACCELAAANPNPATATVAAGSAGFAAAGKTLTVTNTPGTIIKWQGFSIGSGETTHFAQASASSAVLNRVMGRDPSNLLGTLTSNGRVFLVNPHGIVVGPGARVDTAGFIASTLDIADSDFLQGRLRFEGGGIGALRNHGTIRASGDIMLVGPQIENTGLIRSDNGAVLLAAGRKVTITSPDAQGVRFELQSPSDSALNVGTLDARTAAAMFAGTLRHSGDIRAGSASVDEAGRVTLVAQKDAIVDRKAGIAANGARGGEVTVRAGELAWVEGSIEAKGAAGAGGTVHVLGERVGLSGARVDASGETAGGTILVGGDFQGGNPDVPNAKATYVGSDATLKADALRSGDGGKVIVWSDGTTRVHGALSARGGAQSGNGGLVETSGHRLDVVGAPDVRAPHGKGGTWLIDPGEVVITAAGSEGNINIGASPFGSLDENVGSQLLAGTISNFLSTVGSLIITTAGPLPIAGLSGNIIFNASGGDVVIENASASPGAGTLTLQAQTGIVFTGGTTIFRASGNQNFVVAMQPAGGGVATESGATTRFERAGTVAVNATVAPGRNWTNGGTIDLGPGTSAVLSGGAVLNLNGGTLTGAGTFAAPALAWDGGTIGGSGAKTFGSATSIDMLSSVQLTGNVALDGGTWTNNGNLAQSGAGQLTLLNNAIVNNPLTRNWIVSSSSAAPIAGTGTFNNGGTLTTSGLSPHAITSAFRNTGFVGVGDGSTLILGAGGAGPDTGVLILGNNATINFAGDRTLNGSISASIATLAVSGGTVNVNGPVVHTGPVTIAGGIANFNVPLTPSTINMSDGVANFGGTVTSDGGLTVIGGTANFNAPSVVSGAATLSGGVLGGSATLDIGGLTTWGGGAINGPPTAVTRVNGGLAIGGASAKTLIGRTLEIPLGRVATWTGAGNLAVGGGGAINNLGTWQDQSASASIAAASGAGTFVNNGAYLKSGAGTSTIGIAFDNNGPGSTVDAQAGVLRLAGGGSSSRPFAVGGALDFASDYAINPGSSIIGSGGVLFSAGTTAVSGIYNVSSTTASGGNAIFNVPVVAFGAMNADAGTLTLNTGLPVSVPSLNLAGGAIAGGDTLTVSGLTTWSAGGMSGSGTTIASGGALLSGTGLKTLARTFRIPAGASATATAGGELQMSAGATIDNQGAWSDQSSGLIVSGAPSASFANTGTYTKTSSSTTTMGVAFNNTAGGSTSVQAGRLRLTGGGASNRPFTVAVDGTLDFAGGTYTLSPGAAIAAAGALSVSGGTLMAADPLDITGAFVWSGGTITGAGALNTTASATTSVTGTVTLSDKTWNNFGEATLGTSGRVLLGGDGSVPVAVNNRSGGVFNVNTTTSTPFSSTTTTANKTFDNAGTLNLNTGPTSIFGVAATNADTGTINANTGSIGISMSSNAGTINIAGGATLRPASSFTNTGTIGGAGTFDVGSSGTLVNHGTLRPGAAAGDTTGTLGIIGNLVQGPGGAIDLELGGAAAGSFDALTVNGTATLGGTVNVTALPSYTPAIGDAFPVINATTRIGNFSAVNKSFATDMTASYGAANLAFTIGGGPINAWISGSGDWSVGGNWSLGHVPTSSETALLDRPGTLTITIPSGTFTTNALTSSENITIDGGTLTLANASTIDSAFAMNGATLAGAGLLTVNGPTTISGASRLTGRLAASSLVMSGGSLTVSPGGVLNLSAPGRTDLTSAMFGNSGAVNVTLGILALGSGRDAGAYTLASGSALELATGTRELEAGVSFSGAGTLRIAGAAVNVNAPLTQLAGSPSLELAAGSLNMAQSVALNGAFTWSGGTVTGAGTLTTGSTAATSVTGTATLASTRWTNFGAIALNGDGRIVLAGDGALTTLDNRAGGVITDATASAAPIGFAATRASTRFDNSGGFVKAAGSAATQTLDVPMTNAGAGGIAVASGTLVANGLPANAGVIDIAAGAVFSTNGQPLANEAGGVLRGNGTLDLGAATFTNAALVAPGASPGALTIAGNFAQGPGGVLQIEINGRAQGTQYDLLKVTGNAALDGELAITAPLALPLGTTAEFMTYASRAGDFAVKTSPPGVVFEVIPGATGYSAVRTNVLSDRTTRAAHEISSRDAARAGERPPPDHRIDRDERDPKDREERRRVLPECR